MGPISSSFPSSNISHPSPSSLPTPPTSPPVMDSQPKKVPFRIPPPSMSHGLAAHFLAGGENAGLSIESAKLEGFSQQHMLAYFRHVLEDQSKRAGIEKDPKVEQLLEEISGALELEDAIQTSQTHHPKWEGRAKAFIQLMQERIQTLKPGQSLLIPGGWTQAVVGASGHAMLYRVTKTADDSFSFEIYNTGAGVEHHPTAVIEGRTLHAQKIIKKDLQTEQICSPLFWQAHYELKYAPAKDCGLITSTQVYNCFDLMAESFVETASQETLSASDLEIRRDQTTGNCSYESLLAYTKIQLGKSTDLSGRSLYHTLKLGMQLQVLEEYFSYLEKENFFIEPTSAEEASARLRILHLIRAEIHTVQRTLLREKIKRKQPNQKTYEAILSKIKSWNEKLKNTQSIIEKSLEKLSELQLLQEDTDNSYLIEIENIPQPPEIAPNQDLVIKKINTEEPPIITKTSSHEDIKSWLNQWPSILDPENEIPDWLESTILHLPNVKDSFWDTEEAITCFDGISKICDYFSLSIQANIACTNRSVYSTFKMMAIFIKLAARIDPILARTPPDVRFFTNFIGPLEKPFILNYRTGVLEDMQASFDFFNTNNQKTPGLFHEWLQLEATQHGSKGEFLLTPDSMGDWSPHSQVGAVYSYLKENPKIYEKIQSELSHSKDLATIPETAILAEALCSPDYLPSSFLQTQKLMLWMHSFYKSTLFPHKTRPLFQKIQDRATYRLEYFIEEDDPDLKMHIFFTVNPFFRKGEIPAGYQKKTEMEGRSTPNLTLLQMELQNIYSTDDPSLRIINTMNFFSSNEDLLKEGYFQEFIIRMILEYDVNKKETCFIGVFNKNKKIQKFIKYWIESKYEKYQNQVNSLELVFILKINNILEEIFLAKKIKTKINTIESIKKTLKKHLSKENQQQLSLIAFDWLGRQPVEDISNNELDFWWSLLPTLTLPNKSGIEELSQSSLGKNKFLKKILSLSKKERNTFFSKNICCQESISDWHTHEHNPHVFISNDLIVDLEKGQYFYKNREVSSMPDVVLQHPDWNLPFHPSQIKVFAYQYKLFDQIYDFIDTVSQNRYRVWLSKEQKNNRKTKLQFYRFSQEKNWIPIVSLSSLLSQEILARLGIENSKRFTAQIKESTIDIVNKNQEVCFIYNIKQQTLQEVSSKLIASDMDLEDVIKPYKNFILLDPHAQLWKASASSVPSRITLPTFGMTFEIKNGKIWGTGEWEGFQLAKEQHLPALRGFGAKLVLHHEKLGTKVLVAQGEMSSSLDLTKPMSFKTHTDSKKKLLCLSVDTKKRLISTNREEDLYLARLFYHLGRPKAAMCCLEKCKGSDPWTLEQLRSLKTLLNETEKRTTLSDRSVYLKAALLGVNSRKAPYKKWSGTTTASEKSELNALNFTISSAAVNSYWVQITRIASPSLRLTVEEESMLHRLPTTELHVPTSSKKILDVCLLSADHFDRKKISLKRPVQLDLFDHTTIPFTENWDSLSSHFLDFYAIATQGSEKQKQQLALWIKGLICSTPDLSLQKKFDFSVLVSTKKIGFAVLFLKLLAMNHEQIAKLPVMTSEICADEKNFIQSYKKILKSINTVKISSEKESVDPFRPVSFSHRPVGLRKKKLIPSRLTGDTQLQSKTDTFTEIADTEKTTPLSKKSDVLFTQGKSPSEPPLSSLIPLDPKGGKSYDLAFERFAAHLKDVQKAKHSAPIWEISPENLDLLQRDLTEETSGQIPILAKLFRESQQALIKKARTVGLDKEAVSIRELEEASRFVAPIRWSDLLFLFAKRDANAYCLRQPHFTQAQAQELFEDTAKCLALQTQLQKAEKAKELVEELQKTPDPKKTSQLKQLLTGTRDYPVDRFPAILLFEAVTGMQLREDQLHNLEKLGDPNQSWLIEAIMGSGKSEVLIPLFAQTIADGQHLSFAVMPKEQMLSGGTRLEKKLRQYFEQNSIQIDWNNTSLENLQAIHARLKEAIEKKEVVRLYADELQQFFLQEQAVWNSRFQGNPDAMPFLQAFSAIRKLLQEKGVALVDEVHLQLMRKRECQKPLGEKVPVNASFCHVAADLQFLLVQDPTIQKIFRFEFSKNPQKTAVPFSAELHQKEFIRLLSTSFSRKRYEKDLGKQQKVLAFLQAPLEAPINLDTTFTEEEKIALAFARGQIQTILPSTLSKKWGQEYGLFPAQNRNEAPSLLAGPYRGLGRPVIGSTFATPDELLAYTIQSYLVEGLPKAQIAQQISSLVTRARREAATYRRPIAKTAGYQEYRQLIGETQLQQPGFAFDEEKDLDTIKKHLEENPERLIYFLKRFVLSEVSQYPTTTIANGYSFVDLFRATKAVSGTLQAAPTFHQSFLRALKPEIEAEAFALITRDNHKPICLQEKIEGIPLLKQLFSQRSKITPRALIDQAGLIKDPPFVIAQQLLELTSTSDPKVDRIIYFEEDQLLSLERGKTTPTKYHPDACPPDTSFTFYDQAHATGTDIQQMQKAQALVTLGENTTFGDAIQAAFRMRGLDTLQQSVILVTSHELTSSLKAHLKKEPSDWNAADVLSHTKHIQVKIAEEENCKAVLDKLRNLFIKTCKEEMESETQSDQAKAELFQMTLRESRMDPLAAYTSKNELVDTKVIFTKIQIEYGKKLEEKIPPEKLRSMLEQMDTIIQEATDPTNPLVPEKILSKPNTTEAMEVETLQEQQMELNTEQEQEQEQQQQKDLSVIPVDFATSGLPGKKIPLFTPEAAETIDLEKQSTQTTLPEDSFKDSSSIYSFSALAHFGIQKKADKTIDQGTLDQLTKDFPKKILFSLHATIAHSECAPFRKNQLTLDKLLLVPDPTNPKEPYCIALSKAESELWYQAIQNKKLPKGWEGSCLFSVEKEANAGEKEDGICVENEEIPFPIQELRSSFFDPSLTPFEQIIAKTKWIMGETELYHGKEEAYLTHWFQSLGPKNMEKIFQNWFQISRKPYTTSLLERFFKNALEKSIAVSEDGSTSTIISPTVEAPKKPLKISKTLDRSSEITKKDSTPKQKLSFTRRVVAVLFFPFYAVTMALSWPLRWLWKRLQK